MQFSNIVWLDGLLKLLDFGQSAHRGATGVRGLGAGTAGYAAPERAKQRPLHWTMDMYSTGAMMWKCIGTVPELRELATSLTSYLPEPRPTARKAMRILRAACE